MNLKFKIIFLSLIYSGYCANLSAQNSFRNFGNLKVFENSALGFQTNLINDGSFDENLGRIGFYGEEELEISGIYAPKFYDFELFLDGDLLLVHLLVLESVA